VGLVGDIDPSAFPSECCLDSLGWHGIGECRSLGVGAAKSTWPFRLSVDGGSVHHFLLFGLAVQLHSFL
jgi:hypothetical protein